MDALGMPHASEQLEQMLNTAVKEKQAPHLFLDRLLTQEQSRRE